MKLSALKPLGCCVMARLASLLPLLIRGQDRSLTSHKTLRTRTGPLRTRVGPGLRSGPKSVQSSPVLGLFAVLGLDLQTLARTILYPGKNTVKEPHFVWPSLSDDQWIEGEVAMKVLILAVSWLVPIAE